MDDDPPRSEVLRGVFLLLLGGILLAVLWTTPRHERRFIINEGAILPPFAITFGLAFLLFPDWRSERVKRGEDWRGMNPLLAMSWPWRFLAIVAFVASFLHWQAFKNF